MVHFNASWAPPGESPALLSAERSSLDGTPLSCVAYGMLLLLFVQCADVLLQTSNRQETRRWWLLTYISIIFCLATIALGTELKWTEMMFIDDRNFPGGPATFGVAMFSDWIPMLCSACGVALCWFADGFLLYRCLVVWDYQYCIIILPGVVFLGTISISIVWLLSTGMGFFPAQALDLGTAFWSLSISQNILVTTLICARLFHVRHRITSALGSEHGRLYTRICAMLVESAALYSIWGLIVLIAYTKHANTVLNLFVMALSQIQAVASLAIILRVGQGKAYATNNFESDFRLPAIQFGGDSASNVASVITPDLPEKVLLQICHKTPSAPI